MDSTLDNVNLETATTETPAKAAKTPKDEKAPKADKPVKRAKRLKADKSAKAPIDREAEGGLATKPAKAPKGEKTQKAPKAPKGEMPAKRAKRAKAEKPLAAKPMRHRVTFVVKAEPGQEVYLAGNFNDWSPTAKQLKEVSGTGEYRGILALEPGRYEYKFVINGVWEMDHSNPDFVSNGFNTFNSVLVVEA